MSKQYDVNNGQSNPTFLGDDGKIFIPALELELSEKKQPKDEDDYDPYIHRNVEHPTTNADTLIHLLKGSLGTGILAMPKAFFNAGYLVGSIGTVIIGIICTYCIHLLIKAEYELCKRKKVIE